MTGQVSVERIRAAHASGLSCAASRYRRRVTASATLGAEVEAAGETSPHVRPKTRASVAVRIEDYRETLRGHRVLHLVGKGRKSRNHAADRAGPALLEACRGERTDGPLVLRPVSASRSIGATATGWLPACAGGRYPATHQPTLSASGRDHQRSRRRSHSNRSTAGLSVLAAQ